MQVIDPWEEHCVECGEPACFRTCQFFRPAPTGRCRRFAQGIAWRGGARVIQFLAWGKLELLWHGGLAGARIGAVFTWLDRVMPRICRTVWLYRRWRSLRWRLGNGLAWHRRPPGVWHVRCRSAAACRLIASVARPDGSEVLRRELNLRAGEPLEVAMRLPPLEPLSLIRICAYEATPAEVVFERLELTEAPPRQIKCVAWDLDGVLWEGTLSEGEAVALKPEVVKVIRALDARGIVSSICSKNDAAEALAKLVQLGLEELFVFPQIAWGPKSVSLRRLAQEMNIGLEAIAFVDDRPENRQEVQCELPEVLTLDEGAVAGLLERPEFNPARSAQSVQRRRHYREEMARRQVLAHDFAGDAQAFLAQSALQVALLPVEGERVARCWELVQRCNQLTLTARRYSQAAFDRLLAHAECRAVHVQDKYGDYGIVGFVAWRAGRVEELVFSCRVAQKGVERQVLAQLPEGLTLEAVETERNGPIRAIVSAWLAERGAR